jgi:hypothetical protein
MRIFIYPPSGVKLRLNSGSMAALGPDHRESREIAEIAGAGLQFSQVPPSLQARAKSMKPC